MKNEIQLIKNHIRAKTLTVITLAMLAIICTAIGVIALAQGSIHGVTGIIAGSISIGLAIHTKGHIQWWQMRLAQEQRFARRTNRKAF